MTVCALVQASRRTFSARYMMGESRVQLPWWIADSTAIMMVQGRKIDYPQSWVQGHTLLEGMS